MERVWWSDGLLSWRMLMAWTIIFCMRDFRMQFVAL